MSLVLGTENEMLRKVAWGLRADKALWRRGTFVQ